MTTSSDSLRQRSVAASWWLTGLGGIVWLGLILWQPPDPRTEAWGHALLLLAALVLLPLVLPLLMNEGDSALAERLLHIAQPTQFLAALLLLAAYLQPQGTLAGMLSLPWLLVAALLATAGLLRLRGRKLDDLAGPCLDVALVFLVVGGGWTVLHRFGFQPLAFPHRIVLLTAIHFHYAGFLLPLFTGLLCRQLPGRLSGSVAAAVILSVPLTAVGITTTQLDLGSYLETLAALVLAVSGLLVAWLHLQLARRPEPARFARVLWLVASLALVFGMVLAGAYGLRFHVELEWLNDEEQIAWMRALHGSANALGFGLCGALGWRLAKSV